MFGKRIGFLKFTADIYDKAMGKKVYNYLHVYLLNLFHLVENRGHISWEFYSIFLFTDTCLVSIVNLNLFQVIILKLCFTTLK